MSDTMLMVIDNAALQASVVPKAVEMKESALASSALVGRVSNAKEQEVAVAAQAELDTLIRLAEKSRKAIKAPVIALGKEIDGKHEEYIAPVIEDRTRVTRLIADFQELELAKVRAAEAAARLEAEKIERERLAEIRRIQEAEEADRRKLAAEEAAIRAQAVAARNKQEAEQVAALQRELDNQRELARARSLEDMAATQERFNDRSATLAAKPIPTSAKADGQTVSEDWDIEMTNPYAVAKFHPDCVNITLRLTETKATLDRGITMQGIKATRIVKSRTRPTSGQRVIEV